MGRKAQDKAGRKARDDKARPVSGAGTVGEQRQAAKSSTGAARSVPPRPRRPATSWPASAAAWLAVLAVVTTVAYAGSFDTPLLLDDAINITKNPEIQRPLSLGKLLVDPRAVVTASLRWNYLAGGFEVAGYHVLNLVAHILTGFLVFGLAHATLKLEIFRGRYLASAQALAAAAAMIFLVHPIQTESVTYLIQRAEVFAAAGLLGALLALSAARDGLSIPTWTALVASCLFGIYSKPSFVVVPVLLLVYDVCFLSRGRLSEIARRRGAYLVAAAAAAVTFALTQASGAFSGESAGFEMEHIRPADYLAAQFGVVVQYLGVTLWPRDLCFDCGYNGPWPVLAGPLGDSVVVPAAILAGLALASLYFRREQPLLPFAVFGSAVVLLPTSSVVPLSDFYVEHRMYLPIAFLAMALVAVFYDATVAFASRFAVSARTIQIVRYGTACVVVLALGAVTVLRNELLGDPIALMEDALEQAPQNERVHYNLANAYKKVGRADDAIPHYEEAIRLLPHVVRSYQNLGSLYLEQGKVEEARRVYQAGVEAKPEAAVAHRNMANVLLQLGRVEEALASAETARKLEPANANGHRLVGDALLQLGRRAEAASAWRSGLAAVPGDPMLKERLRKVEAH